MHAKTIGLTNDPQIAQIVTELATRKDPREIADAVRYSAVVAGGVSSFSLAPSLRNPKATLNLEVIGHITGKYGGLSMLNALSPADLKQWDPESLLDALFPNNPLLCLARSPRKACTRRRERFRGHEIDFPLPGPSPMTTTRSNKRPGNTPAQWRLNRAESGKKAP